MEAPIVVADAKPLGSEHEKLFAGDDDDVRPFDVDDRKPFVGELLIFVEAVTGDKEPSDSTRFLAVDCCLARACRAPGTVGPYLASASGTGGVAGWAGVTGERRGGESVATDAGV